MTRVVTDSSSDLPAEMPVYHRIRIAPSTLRVAETLLGQVEIGPVVGAGHAPAPAG